MEKISAKPHQIHIINAQDKLPVSVRCQALLRRVVRAVLDSEGVQIPCELTIKLVNNNQIRYLNRKLRGISKATDVLSFPSGDDEEEDLALSGRYYLGDMAISLERAQRQSRQYGHSYEREISFLTAHSVLHLLGYDHMEPQEEKQMFAKQEAVLTGLGIMRD